MLIMLPEILEDRQLPRRRGGLQNLPERKELGPRHRGIETVTRIRPCVGT